MKHNMDLTGTGVERGKGATLYGTATHFVGPDGFALCGANIVRHMDPEDWCSYTTCLRIARREAAA